MKAPTDPALVAFTGSETRVLVLAPAANSPAPLSAYKIAVMAGLPRTKVYRELRRLESTGIVARSKSQEGTALWWVIDEDIRQLLRRRARIGLSDDLSQSAEGLELRTRKVLEFARRNPISADLLAKPASPRFPEEFRRIRQKDEILGRLGLRKANRASPD